MSEEQDGKNRPRRFIQSSRETINQIIKERNHGPGCPCNTCYIMEHEGASEAKEQLPGSFLVERRKEKDVLPS